jgi:hypothetical protein
MGLWNIFSRDEQAALKKHAQRVANKRSQAPDRWESIHALAAMRSSEAIEALLVRFTYTTDPSITDQEEKDAVFDAVVQAEDVALEPVRRFLSRAESLGWPLKLLQSLLSPQDVLSELLRLLGKMDTEYERDPQRKIQVLAALEERQDPRIAEAAQRFLDDVNETVRFHAVGALLAQDDASQSKDPLLHALIKEESVRVRSRILDGFAQHQWSVGTSAKALQLPPAYRLDTKGVPHKR